MLRILAIAVVALALGAHARLEAATGDVGVAKAKDAATALQRGRADEAVLLYTAALADAGLSADRRASFLNDRGVANSRLNRLRAAIDDFNASVRLAPETASTYNNRGNVLLALGLAAEAEKDFNRAIALSPGYSAAYVNRANARALAGDGEAALKDFSQAVRLSPKSPAAFGGRGRLHLAANRPHAAVREFNRAIANDERYGPGYRMRAEAMVLLGRFEDAVADLSRAIAFEPGNADLYLARGYGYLAARNPSSAIKDFQRSSELNGKVSTPFEGLGLAQARVGAHDDALDTLSRALEIHPRSAPAYAYRAVVYKTMGQPDLALKDLDRAVRLDPTSPEVNWAKGELHETQGQKDEAIVALRQALAGRPHLRDAALALERLGAYEGRDAEVAELAFGRWRVFVGNGRYTTTNAEYPRLTVPLEMMSEGAPRIIEFEVKGGSHAGLGILRFSAGHVDGSSGPEEVEHGAVLDLQAKTVLAVETMRQGAKSATWSWEEDKLVVTSLDGFKQEYAFKGAKARDEVAGKQDQDAPQKAKARSQPRPNDQAWNPWGSSGSGNRKRPPKTLFEMIFGN